MRTYYAREDFPASCTSSVFLAGPTPRSSEVESWRPQALEFLADLDIDVVLIPEDRSGEFRGEYVDQVEWEEEALNRADVILFWIPRDLDTMPAFTSNVEFGVWARSGKVVYGRPDDSPKNRYLDHYAEKYGHGIHSTLEAACLAVEGRIHDWYQNGNRQGNVPPVRTEGECRVPLHVWSTPQFQSWYADMKAAGNRLDGFRVLWAFFPRSNPVVPFCWVAHADVWIAREQRSKTNEFVIGRPDIFCVALMNGQEIVYVREFRSPVSNLTGYVHELPGGSSKPGQDGLAAAREELREETGLDIEERRFKLVGTRQIAATILSHKATLYRVQLSDGEADRIARTSLERGYFGAADDSELTWPEITTFEKVEGLPFDWSMIGMVAEARGKG